MKSLGDNVTARDDSSAFVKATSGIRTLDLRFTKAQANPPKGNKQNNLREPSDCGATPGATRAHENNVSDPRLDLVNQVWEELSETSKTGITKIIEVNIAPTDSESDPTL